MFQYWPTCFKRTIKSLKEFICVQILLCWVRTPNKAQIATKKTHQYEAIIESIQIGTSSADLPTDCGSIDKYVLWIFKIWKCYSISRFCYPRRMLSIFSHHCLPLLLLNLHISSRFGWSSGATIQDTHFCDSPIHR